MKQQQRDQLRLALPAMREIVDEILKDTFEDFLRESGDDSAGLAEARGAIRHARTFYQRCENAAHARDDAADSPAERG